MPRRLVCGVLGCGVVWNLSLAENFSVAAVLSHAASSASAEGFVGRFMPRVGESLVLLRKGGRVECCCFI